MFSKTLASAALTAFASAQIDLEFTQQGEFKIHNAAFININSFEDSEDFMLVSTFGPVTHGNVYVVPGLKEAVVAGDISTLQSYKLDTPDFTWPNNIAVVPQDVFGERAIHVPDGFVVPMHGNGGIYIVRMDETDLSKTKETVKITAHKRGYFYHMGYWLDLNGDGRKDFLTARSNGKKGEGELLWLEHPEDGLNSGDAWTEHVIGNLADVGFLLHEMEEYPDEVIIFVAHFFDEAVRMLRVSTVDGTLVQAKTIDDTEIMSAYSVTVVDLNGDGKQQLMVNNHQKKNKDAGIWAYEFPEDPMNDDWSRVPLATDFHNAFSLTVPNMSPGFPYVMYPNGQKEGEKAHIMVAGDGDHAAHAMYPSADGDF